MHATFLPHLSNVLNQKTWIIPKEAIQNFTKELLNSLVSDYLIIENPVQFLGVSTLDPEIVLSIFRAIVKENYLKYTGEEILPIRVSITNCGKK